MGNNKSSSNVEEAKKFSSVFISVVVARNGDKFCCTDEKYGWYLPAGRVDYGESFSTAAVREAKEEAGMDCELEGILRFEYSFAKGDFVRFRSIYAGRPKDGKEALKTVADDETYAAYWFTLQEVYDLIKKVPAMMEKVKNLPYRLEQAKQKVKRKYTDERFRGAREVYGFFEWAQDGTKVFKNEIYRGVDGTEADSNRVEVATQYFVQLIVKNITDNTFCVASTSLYKLTPFDEVAKFLAKGVANKLEKASSVEPSSICGILHEAPKTFKKEHCGKMCLCYYAETEFDPTLQKNDLEWIPMDFDASKVQLSDTVKIALENIKSDAMAPMEFLAWEGSQLVKL